MNKSFLIATLCLSLLPFSFCHAAESRAAIPSVKTLNDMGLMHHDYGKLETRLFAHIDNLNNPKILLMGEAFGRLTKKVFEHLQVKKKSGEIYVNDLDPRHLHQIRQWAADKTNSRIKIYFIEGDINEKLPELIKDKGSEYFDIITAFSLLHFFNPVQIGDHLMNVYLALKKGGASYYAFMTPECLKVYPVLETYVPSFSSLDELREMTARRLFERKAPTLEAAREKYRDSSIDQVLADYIMMNVYDVFRTSFNGIPEHYQDILFDNMCQEVIKKILHDIVQLRRSYIYEFNVEHQLPFPGALYTEDSFAMKTCRFLGGDHRLDNCDETYLDGRSFEVFVKGVGFELIFMQPFSIYAGRFEEREDGIDLACIIKKPLNASIQGLEVQLTPLNQDPVKKLHLELHRRYEISNEVRYCAPHYTISKKKTVIKTPAPTCNSCAETGKDLLTCARCKEARYCNPTCQKKDWPLHKNVCRPPLRRTEG